MPKTGETAQAVVPRVDVVNGPEDDLADWHQIDWSRVEGDVRRLRQRIFAASQAGDLKRVRNLQKLMLRSRANALLSVRRVTEVNAGRETAGVDGKVVLLPQSKAELADWVQRHCDSWTPKPVKRVYIPKAGGKQRPLGIPVIVDRVLQARAANALEPEWEAWFEPRSYGFRPGRSCQDAIAAIFLTCKGKSPQRQWVLDADLKAAFDHIDHNRLLTALGTFPAREQLVGWLTAGVVEQDWFTPTERGTPQGGVVSPVMLNVALHGLEEAAGVRYRRCNGIAADTRRHAPVLVRYADDLVVLCHTRAQVIEVKARLAEWLAPRGLVFNEDKTRIGHLTEGFDFLGFNVRHYRNGRLLIKPSTAAVRRIRNRLSAELRALRGANAAAVIRRLNPIIRGWAAYYRGVVSSEVFASLDHHVWRLTYRWARHSHPNKSRSWVVARYFDQFNRARQDRWVFGDRESGAYLVKFAWTKIVRHQMVTGRSSPDDPALVQYWAERRRKRKLPPMDKRTLRLLRQQAGRCPSCGQYLLYADHEPQSPQEWQRWFTVVHAAMRKQHIAYWRHGTSDETDIRLIHTHCQRQHDNDDGVGPALRAASEPTGLA